jgi:hypothetical protein
MLTGWMSRIALLALLIPLFATFVIADTFQISFTGAVAGTGTIVTNGVCVTCTKIAGLNDFTASFPGFDSGASAFDLSDDFTTTLSFSPAGQFLSGTIGNSETLDQLIFPVAPVFELDIGQVHTGGGYSISAVPESSSLITFATVLAMLGFLSRRKPQVGMRSLRLRAQLRKRIHHSSWTRRISRFFHPDSSLSNADFAKT